MRNYSKLLTAYYLLLRARRGQSLVEVLVALTVFTMGFLGIFALLTQSLALNNSATNSYVASNLAGEGIEVVKNILDGEITKGVPWSDVRASTVADGCYEVDYSSTDLSASLGDCTPQDAVDVSTRLNREDATELYGYGTGFAFPYRRVVKIETVSDNEMAVTSVVRWDSHGNTYKGTLEDHFYNWRP